MSIVIMIPSRMASTRFPGKPLVDIAGTPMVVRVAQQAQKAGVGNVYIAAGDQEIADAAKAHGIDAIMTDAALPNGSVRIWQGVQRLMEKGMPKPSIIINAQGDEPVLPPELFGECAAILTKRPEVDVVTFAHPITSADDFANTTKVKIATTGTGRALYFSRSPIPHSANPMLRHIGFYGYRYEALESYVAAPEGILENTEKLEQLRGLEIGLHYHVALTHYQPIGVDTPADLDAVKKLLAAA